MLSQTQVEQFQRDGFLNGGGLLSDAEVEEFRAEVMRVIDQREHTGIPQPVFVRNLNKDDSKSVWQIVNIWQASPAFKRLMMRPEITSSIAQLTGATELRIWHDQILFKPPEIGGQTDWHQDAPLWPNIAPMTEVTAWVALDDADESNGCMSMVPGSHTWGNQIDFLRTVEVYDSLPAEYDGHKVNLVRCPVKKGEVHFHHALTWHGSHSNTSDRPRRAIALSYMTGETRYVEAGSHPMKNYVTVADGEILQGDTFPLVYPIG